MPGLIVNLNGLAVLRNSKESTYPDPAAGAVLAELGGACGISVHYHPTHPQITERDLRILKEMVHGELIMGMAPTSEMMGMALDIKPDGVTLMQANAANRQTPSTVDLILEQKELDDIVANIQGSGIPVSILVEPDPDQIKSAHRLNVDGVQIHTGAFGLTVDPVNRRRRLARILDASKLAAKLKLRVTAGCGLNYGTVPPLSTIQEIDACVIGHGIIARALFTGLESAVREMVIQLDRS
ncbi:MAG: pyridoxine 5'-phosphate synthase [Desulfobacterales bacterium]|jgi:pyridoxine 5-phosphate synthase